MPALMLSKAKASHRSSPQPGHVLYGILSAEKEVAGCAASQ